MSAMAVEAAREVAAREWAAGTTEHDRIGDAFNRYASYLEERIEDDLAERDR